MCVAPIQSQKPSKKHRKKCGMFKFVQLLEMLKRWLNLKKKINWIRSSDLIFELNIHIYLRCQVSNIETTWKFCSAVSDSVATFLSVYRQKCVCVWERDLVGMMGIQIFTWKIGPWVLSLNKLCCQSTSRNAVLQVCIILFCYV